MCHFRYIFIHARSWVLDSASLGFLYRFPARTILVLLPANSGNQQATHLHDRWLLLLGYPLHWTDAWADRSQFHCSSDSQETRAVQPLHNQHKLEKGEKERKAQPTEFVLLKAYFRIQHSCIFPELPTSKLKGCLPLHYGTDTANIRLFQRFQVHSILLKACALRLCTCH